MSSFSDLQGGVKRVGNYVWDTNTLSWTKATGGGSGNNVSVTNFPSSFGSSQVGTWTVGVTSTVPVSGTFWQATQPVSATSLPLPSGASTEATLAKVPGLSIPIHDYISLAQGGTTDTWSYKVGGIGGTLVATVTITYTDSTKTIISTVAKT